MPAIAPAATTTGVTSSGNPRRSSSAATNNHNVAVPDDVLDLRIHELLARKPSKPSLAR